MKKITCYILLTAIIVLCLSGCGTDEKEPSSASNTEGAQGELDDLEALNPGGQDNSLDAYSAAVNTPLQVENSVNAIEGGGKRIFLGASRAYYFKKHLFENVDECWDELSFVTAEGQMGSERFERENQLWDVGPIAGTDHYVTFD